MYSNNLTEKEEDLYREQVKQKYIDHGVTRIPSSANSIEKQAKYNPENVEWRDFDHFSEEENAKRKKAFDSMKAQWLKDPRKGDWTKMTRYEKSKAYLHEYG